MFYYYFYNFSYFQAFVNLLMWFQIFNGFSGVAQVDDINLLIFSVVYTSIPPIVMGVLDQNMPDSTLMAFPHLYDRCQSSKVRHYKHINNSTSMIDAYSFFYHNYVRLIVLNSHLITL